MACHVGILLKGEVLGSRFTNNLIMESEKTHNGKVRVGTLQRCEPGAHGVGSSHGAGCHKNINFLCDNPSRSLGIRLTVMQGTDPNSSIIRSIGDNSSWKSVVKG